jgi:hypothetical protein
MAMLNNQMVIISYKRWGLVTRVCSKSSSRLKYAALVVSHLACEKSPGKNENTMCTLCDKILAK